MAKRTQGMNWIRREKRLALYLRDGLACVYCGERVEDGAQLTLDHLRPYSKGGTNHEMNLVTACHRCNSRRGSRTVRGFCRAVSAYLNHNIAAREIERHVRRCAARQINVQAARALIERRGNWAQCLKKQEGLT